MISAGETALVVLAAGGAGAINALAGGGTLISFPTLLALGVPAVAANVTNTVALCPGYLGGTLAQRSDLRGQRRRLLFLVPAGVLGGLLGGWLLLHTGEREFRRLVPFLILLASGLLLVQEPLRNRLRRAAAGAMAGGRSSAEAVAAFPLLLAAVYGGYFGAGLSVILLAVLGLCLDDSLHRLNAIKQAVAFSANVAAAVFFLFSGKVRWELAGLMAVSALAGGALGGRLAGRVRPAVLRGLVVILGTAVGLIYLFKR